MDSLKEISSYKMMLAEKILKALPSEKVIENCHKDLKAKREIYNAAIQECKKIIKDILIYG